MKRGTVKEKPAPAVAPKQNLIQSNEVHTGRISRRYQTLPKFSITEPGKRPYEAYSSKTLTQLRKAHPTWAIHKIKY